jgi:membrane protein
VRPDLRAWASEALDVVRATYDGWRDDRTIRLGAGLAYYGLFSLTSVVAVAFGLLRIVGRNGTLEAELTDRITELGGAQAADAVSEAFNRLDGSAGTTVGLVGLGSLLITGSLFFLALEDAIHQIWDVPVRVGLRSSMRRRLISLVVLLGAAATLVLALAVQAASSVLERFVPGSAPGLELLSTLLTSAASWSVLAGALVLLFKYLPTVDVAWRPMLVAAVVTSAFIVIGTALIGWYLRTVGASSLGGVASTPLAVLVWIYYEAQILLAGIQLSKVLGQDWVGSTVVTE